MSLSIDSTIKLASGNLMPRLGYGVYQARGAECQNGVTDALKAGYRHVDSAQGYHNEDLVAKGVANSNVPRKEIFLTTKYMPTHNIHSASAVYKYLTKSLPLLDKSSSEPYIDLFLIHAPFGGPEGRANNWKALAQAQSEGWVRDIGVSNFGVRHLKELPSPRPTVNQIELHPWCQQKEIAKYCLENDITVQAYCPLVRADPKKLNDPVIKKLCDKHGTTPAQILVRWSLQKGYVPLPKSVHSERIKTNADVYNFNLDESDMKALDSLDQGAAGACSWNPVDVE